MPDHRSPEGGSSRLGRAKLRATPESWPCPDPALDKLTEGFQLFSSAGFKGCSGYPRKCGTATAVSKYNALSDTGHSK